jgi:uncharacterized protein YbaR (Trm112 family)
MAIVFCPNCQSSLYLMSSEDQVCPVCSGSLDETEETIKDLIIPA